MKKYRFPKDKRLFASSNIRQTHSVILRMLKVLSIICSKHNIDFWLDYGTLLGAVRHKGFIPWDHEADIGMLRSDFEAFEKISNELPEDIFLQTRNTDPFYREPSVFIEAKLRDKYSNYIEFEKACPSSKWHNGIQVDIFIYDYDKDGSGLLTNSFERLQSNSKIFLYPAEIEYTISEKFEDYSFQIPKGYDAYLKRNYGNYMELPSEELRCAQHVDIIRPCRHSEILHWNC